MCRRIALSVLAMLIAALQADAQELRLPIGSEFDSADTLAPAVDPSADARECIAGLCWKPAQFQVRCQTPTPDRGDALIRFPSPVVTGDAKNDQVAMEWYAARDDAGRVISAPAVVVVHESGSGMTVGRLFARGLSLRGLHTFMIHLPFYGERRTGRERPPASNIFTVMKQAIADVRRARDAVSVLPGVDKLHIALHGTSLGGFVSAATGSMDDGFDSVFLMLAGGELYDLIQTGKRDTAKVREHLQEAGITDSQLRKLTQAIEPTRIGHRLHPQRTWLYSGTYDTVVPLRNAQVLAAAARLDKLHHIQMAADHYTGIVYLPFLLKHIAEQIKTLHADAADSDSE